MEAEPEITCTAGRNAQGDLPNPLFTPPCDCPNCRAEPVATSEGAAETMWLTIDGRRIRLEVDSLELGSESSSLL